MESYNRKPKDMPSFDPKQAAYRTADRKDPDLWEEVKSEWMASSKGGKPGQWSARKAQLAVQDYKKRGGEYKGNKKRDNSLAIWTAEEWGTKSGKPSVVGDNATGERYLPKYKREMLSDEEYKRTSDSKRRAMKKGRQFASQPKEIKNKVWGDGRWDKVPEDRWKTAGFLRQFMQKEAIAVVVPDAIRGAMQGLRKGRGRGPRGGGDFAKLYSPGKTPGVPAEPLSTDAADKLIDAGYTPSYIERNQRPLRSLAVDVSQGRSGAKGAGTVYGPNYKAETRNQRIAEAASPNDPVNKVLYDRMRERGLLGANEVPAYIPPAKPLTGADRMHEMRKQNKYKIDFLQKQQDLGRVDPEEYAQRMKVLREQEQMLDSVSLKTAALRLQQHEGRSVWDVFDGDEKKGKISVSGRGKVHTNLVDHDLTRDAVKEVTKLSPRKTLYAKLVDDSVGEQAFEAAGFTYDRAKMKAKGTEDAFMRLDKQAGNTEVLPSMAKLVSGLRAARKATDTNPSEAQKKSDRFKKGTFKWRGHTIKIENPKGSTRSGTNKDGKAWSHKMSVDYGYFSRTKGADGDHLDVFIGPDLHSDYVLVINQVDPESGKFDEHKIVIGHQNEESARAAYLSCYEKGWKGIGSVKGMTKDQFEDWMKGNTTKEAFDKEPLWKQGALGAMMFRKAQGPLNRMSDVVDPKALRRAARKQRAKGNTSGADAALTASVTAQASQDILPNFKGNVVRDMKGYYKEPDRLLGTPGKISGPHPQDITSIHEKAHAVSREGNPNSTHARMVQARNEIGGTSGRKERAALQALDEAETNKATLEALRRAAGENSRARRLAERRFGYRLGAAQDGYWTRARETRESLPATVLNVRNRLAEVEPGMAFDIRQRKSALSGPLPPNAKQTERQKAFEQREREQAIQSGRRFSLARSARSLLGANNVGEVIDDYRQTYGRIKDVYGHDAARGFLQRVLDERRAVRGEVLSRNMHEGMDPEVAKRLFNIDVTKEAMFKQASAFAKTMGKGTTIDGLDPRLAKRMRKIIGYEGDVPDGEALRALGIDERTGKARRMMGRASRADGSLVYKGVEGDPLRLVMTPSGKKESIWFSALPEVSAGYGGLVGAYDPRILAQGQGKALKHTRMTGVDPHTNPLRHRVKRLVEDVAVSDYNPFSGVARRKFDNLFEGGLRLDDNYEAVVRSDPETMARALRGFATPDGGYRKLSRRQRKKLIELARAAQNGESVPGLGDLGGLSPLQTAGLGAGTAATTAGGLAMLNKEGTDKEAASTAVRRKIMEVMRRGGYPYKFDKKYHGDLVDMFNPAGDALRPATENELRAEITRGVLNTKRLPSGAANVMRSRGAMRQMVRSRLRQVENGGIEVPDDELAALRRMASNDYELAEALPSDQRALANAGVDAGLLKDVKELSSARRTARMAEKKIEALEAEPKPTYEATRNLPEYLEGGGSNTDWTGIYPEELNRPPKGVKDPDSNKYVPLPYRTRFFREMGADIPVGLTESGTGTIYRGKNSFLQMMLGTRPGTSNWYSRHPQVAGGYGSRVFAFDESKMKGGAQPSRHAATDVLAKNDPAGQMKRHRMKQTQSVGGVKIETEDAPPLHPHKLKYYGGATKQNPEGKFESVDRRQEGLEEGKHRILLSGKDTGMSNMRDYEKVIRTDADNAIDAMKGVYTPTGYVEFDDNQRRAFKNIVSNVRERRKIKKDLGDDMRTYDPEWKKMRYQKHLAKQKAQSQQAPADVA